MKRNLSLDALKGVLILLVVIGHLIESYQKDVSNAALYTLIYSFHMPLFVFISGYFTNTGKNGYFHAVWRIMETFLIFQCVRNVDSICDGDFIQLITPGYTLWYLLSLSYWRVMIYYISRFANDMKKVLFCSLLLALIVGFIPISTQLSFQRTFYYFPFFCLGYFSRQYDFVEMIKRKIPLPLALMTFLTIGVGAFLTKGGYGYLFYGSFCYSSALFFIFRVSTLLIGFVASVSFVRIFGVKAQWLIRLGENTLFVYIYHSFIIQILNKLVSVMELPTSFVFMPLYLVLVLSVLYIGFHLKIARIMLNPISYLFNKYKKV